MRIVLNILACILFASMLVQPTLAAKDHRLIGKSDLSLLALGLAGCMLGRSRRQAVKQDA
jgi:hypothetical protein